MIITKAEYSPDSNQTTLFIENSPTITISRSDYKKVLEVGCNKEESFPFELDDKHYDSLLILAEKLECIKYGLAVLAYGDKSERMLKMKFSRKGFSQKAQKLAINLFKKNGYIDDDNQCKYLVIKLCNEKHFGIRRIKQELFKKGYSSQAINLALSETEADFDAAAREAFVSLAGKYNISDQKEKSRLFSAMMRMGHNSDIVKSLMSIEE